MSPAEPQLTPAGLCRGIECTERAEIYRITQDSSTPRQHLPSEVSRGNSHFNS